MAKDFGPIHDEHLLKNIRNETTAGGKTAAEWMAAALGWESTAGMNLIEAHKWKADYYRALAESESKEKKLRANWVEDEKQWAKHLVAQGHDTEKWKAEAERLERLYLDECEKVPDPAYWVQMSVARELAEALRVVQKLPESVEELNPDGPTMTLVKEALAHAKEAGV